MISHTFVVWYIYLARELASQADGRAFLSMRTWLIIMMVLIAVYEAKGGAVPQKGVPSGPKKQGLSPFGEWVDSLCTVLETSQTDIARAAGLDQSTVSFNTRGASPRRETVQRLWQAFFALAQRKGVALPYYVEMCFFNSAGFASPGQLDFVASLLETFRNDYNIGYEREIEELKQTLQEREDRIRQLEADVHKDERS